MRSSNSLIAGFIAAVLVLLTASLLILSFRMRGTLIDLNERTDQAVKLGEQMNALLSNEVNSVVGFQATREARYHDSYRAQRASIADREGVLERMMASLGPTIGPRFNELQSALRDWHHSIDALELTTQVMPSDEFRRVVFDRLFLMRRAQAAMNRFNEAVLTYQSTQRSREQRRAYLFMALAVIFGPMALSAVVLMTHVLRRLSATTSFMEKRAREEEALRQVGHSLTGGLSMQDVLRRITDAAAVLAAADSVCIETVDLAADELTCIAGRGSDVPASGTKMAFAGSLAQEVLQDRSPKILTHVDLERHDHSLFLALIRGRQNCSAMVIPLSNGNQPLGAMCLVRRAGKRFTYDEAPKLRILADMASNAMHRALAVEKFQAMEEEERFMAQASAALASSLDYKRTVKSVAQLAVPRLADVCIVHLVERQRTYHADIACAEGIERSVAEQLRDKHRERSDLPDSVESALRTRKALLLPRMSDELLKAHAVDDDHLGALRRLALNSVMVLPMIVGHHTLGALVFFAVGDRSYTEDDLNDAKRVALRAALAIHNAQLYQMANEAIESRDEVFRTVSHDLRSPLTAIALSAELLRDTSLPYGRRQTLLRSITGASQRMNRLIDDLLAVGRLRAGQKLALDLHREDPADMVTQVCEIIGPQAIRNSVALRCSTPPAPLPSILVDRSRILQALTNVLDNAFKFTPAGGDILVSCTARDGKVTFAVTDTGKGIDPADLDKLFDPFWQAQGAAYMGTGLGLAIAKAIVEQHGGRIWVESKLGVGTTVSFTIPVAVAGEEPLKAA